MKTLSVMSEWKEASTGATILTNNGQSQIYARPVGDTSKGVRLDIADSKSFEEAMEVKGSLARSYTQVTVDGNETLREDVDYLVPARTNDGRLTEITSPIKFKLYEEDGVTPNTRDIFNFAFPLTTTADDGTLAWTVSSSDESICTVEKINDGDTDNYLQTRATAVGIGKCTVTTTDVLGNSATVELEVTTPNSTSISITNKTELEIPMYVGDKLAVETEVLPTEAIQTPYITMEEGDYFTAYVSNGLVVAYKDGVQTLRVRDIVTGFEDTATITVSSSTLSVDLTLENSTIAPTDTTQASTSHIPASAPVTIVYSSDDDLVATVDADTGLVTGVADGTCNIIALDTISGLSDSEQLEVVTP